MPDERKQRQKYLPSYLKDVAEHFAVVDRSCEGSTANSTCPPSMQNMNSNSVPFGEAASNLSQAEIHRMLEAELSTARVGAGPDEGDEENSQAGLNRRLEGWKGSSMKRSNMYPPK